jgi:hypothetical protein
MFELILITLTVAVCWSAVHQSTKSYLEGIDLGAK